MIELIEGLAHPRSFERIAVGTHAETIRRLVELAGLSIPGQLRLFPNLEREQAEAWASEGLNAPWWDGATAAVSLQLGPHLADRIGET
jgi:hypothetical protein